MGLNHINLLNYLRKCTNKKMNESIILEAGVDEAGRGPLAGPVMAAAVILDPKNKIEGLKDSKSLSSKRRSELEKEIKEKSIAWNVASINRAEIDSINILQASLKAMREAVRGLSQSPQKILLDGNNPIDVGIPCEAIISGDKKIESIKIKHEDESIKKIETDYDYLYRLYEKTIKHLTIYMNRIHEENQSERYWRIIIGPWLVSQIAILWDRWELLREVFEKLDIDTTKCLKYKIKNLIS